MLGYCSWKNIPGMDPVAWVSMIGKFHLQAKPRVRKSVDRGSVAIHDHLQPNGTYVSVPVLPTFRYLRRCDGTRPVVRLSLPCHLSVRLMSASQTRLRVM